MAKLCIGLSEGENGEAAWEVAKSDQTGDWMTWYGLQEDSYQGQMYPMLLAGGRH